MKKVFSLLLAVLFSSLLVSAPSHATSQTVILRPTSAELGTNRIYLDSNTTPYLTVGGGVLDLENVLIEDGQVAAFDPGINGDGDTGSQSLAFIDYDKTSAVCDGALIQGIKLHVVWSSEATASSSHAAVLVIAGTLDGHSNLDYRIDSQDGSGTATPKMFGGIINPPLGNYSGQPPLTLTSEEASILTLPTEAELKSPEARILVSLGESRVVPNYGIGYLDTAYLEVTFDDANCEPTSIDATVIKPPKTGAALTAGIIAAGFTAVAGASLFGAKRTKLKHRVSERE